MELVGLDGSSLTFDSLIRIACSREAVTLPEAALARVLHLALGRVA
jgi:hypothetical protein